MRTSRYLLTSACLALLLASASHSRSGLSAGRPDGDPTPDVNAAGPHAGSWYFAVSGDSRDCGDLLMPKIARHLADHQAQTPASFYWHLGDFRALYRVDCDMGKRELPTFRCLPRDTSPDQTPAMLKRYLAGAWDDFKKEQVSPFEAAGIPIFLGIGNHELANGKTRADYRDAFGRWLKHDWIQAQRAADRKKGIESLDGDTFYHFVKNGVDFIYLDNAANNAFQPEEVSWLSRVLAADAADNSVKTIIVGMHQALPGSTSSNHAMDDGECADVCVARRVYDSLYAAQKPSGPASKPKNVYVFASHSHYIQKNVYDTDAHKGRVVTGWIVGTAGAEQYHVSAQDILYGYLLVEVRPDGTVGAEFKEVTRGDPPVPPGSNGLADFCFGGNHVNPPMPKPKPTPCPVCPPG